MKHLPALPVIDYHLTLSDLIAPNRTSL